MEEKLTQIATKVWGPQKEHEFKKSKQKWFVELGLLLLT